MTRTVVFDIWGPYGLFRKPYAAVSPVSFPFPPPPAVLGMVGAICGIAKDRLHDTLAWNAVRIGVRPLTPTRTYRAAVNLLNTKDGTDRYFRPAKNACHMQVPFEFLREPSFRVFSPALRLRCSTSSPIDCGGTRPSTHPCWGSRTASPRPRSWPMPSRVSFPRRGARSPLSCRSETTSPCERHPTVVSSGCGSPRPWTARVSCTAIRRSWSPWTPVLSTSTARDVTRSRVMPSASCDSGTPVRGAPRFETALARPGEPLGRHLVRVADRVACLLGGLGGETRSAAVLAALCHDLGKATRSFQACLAGAPRTEDSRHAAFGALWVWWAGATLSPTARMSATLAVLRHHSRVRGPWKEELVGLGYEAAPSGLVARQLEDADIEGIARFLRAETTARGLTLPDDVPTRDALIDARPGGLALHRALAGGRSLDGALRFVAVIGALVREDRSDAAMGDAVPERPPLPPDLVARYRESRFPAASERPLDACRREIAESVEREWRASRAGRLFTLTAPTGTGKTLALLGAALRACGGWDDGGAPRRIVYCLPFTAIIDQTERVVADVLERGGLAATSDRLLKHHHLALRRYTTDDGGEFEWDGAGRVLTKSWRAEIVVTTFHQLLYGLLSDRGGDLQRATALVRSIVVLDEVQAVPLRYWDGLRALFQAASRALDTTFVLATATRPLLFRPGDAVELLPEHERRFRSFARVALEVRLDAVTPLDDLARHIATAWSETPSSTLVVLNRRGSVADLYRKLVAALPEARVLPLSNALTPRDRLTRISEIRRRLEAHEPLLVVSTQLVEAGVDLSFAVAHRDFAPLDAVIQTCGRCNRHGEGETAGVSLWRIGNPETGRTDASRIYDLALLEATEEALAGRRVVQEADFLEVTARYFALCHDRARQDDITALLAGGRLGALAESFRLIEDAPVRSWFVSGGAYDDALWKDYQAFVRGDEDAARRFRRRERAFFERVVQVRARVGHDGVRRATTYDPVLGLGGEGRG